MQNAITKLELEAELLKSKSGYRLELRVMLSKVGNTFSVLRQIPIPTVL